MIFFKYSLIFIFTTLLFANNNLSLEEKKWIQKNKLVKVGVDSNWPPFDFLVNNKHMGISSDYLKYITKKTGLKFEIYADKWDNVLKKIIDKKIDILACAAETKTRNDYLHFTTAYLSVDIVVVGKKDTKIESFEEIKEFTIALPKDNFIHENLRDDFPSLKFVFVKSNEEALEYVSFGKADLYIGNLPVVSYFVDNNHLTNLKILFKTPYDKAKLSIAVRKENGILYSILEKTITSMPKSEKEKIYQNWVSLDYKIKIDYTTLWKFLFVFLVIVIVFIYWNRKLKNEINEKELAKKELEESRNFINAMMNSQTNIVIATHNNSIQVANQAFFDFTGFKNLEKFKEKFNCICDLFDTKKPSKYLIPIRDEVYWVDEVLNAPGKLHKALIYNNNKKHIFKVTAAYVSKQTQTKTAVFTDITELINLHEMLEITKNQALNATKAKGEFLANMSHEIRTPMNSVIGFAELLDKEISNPMQKDYLNSIKKGGKALLRIINDILDLSKVEAGKMEIKNEIINPKNFFFEMKSIFEPKILSKNLNFIIEIDEKLPTSILVDGVRLRQILFNLIGNAIKFTEKGFIKISVRSIYKNKDDKRVDLLINIEDSGIGIEKEEQKIIFKAFEQQKNQSVEKYGGTGLGLAISSKLVTMMNGKISITSEKMKGSIFTVILKDIYANPDQIVPTCERINRKDLKFKKATILIVDDVYENRKLIKEALKEFDFNLIMARNGNEALEKIELKNINLILMDLRMPKMNGYEATQKIKQNIKYKHIPIIALTASVMEKDLQKIKKLKFDAYLKKPVLIDELIEKIALFLPYKFKKNKKHNTKNKEENISKETFEKYLLILNKQIKNEWMMVNGSGDFSQIKIFILNLYVLAKKSKIEILINYCEEILVHLESFDIEKVDFLMNNYENLIKEIKLLKENSYED